jgi:hypothetical protein
MFSLQRKEQWIIIKGLLRISIGLDMQFYTSANSKVFKILYFIWIHYKTHMLNNLMF